MLPHFVSQVVTPTRWTITCTFGVMYHLILDNFCPFHYFFLEFIFKWYTLTLPCHLLYETYFAEILRGFKGLSWLVMSSGAVCVQNNTIKGRLSFLQLFLKLIPLVKLELLERLRSEDTPRHLMITHTIESCWIPSQNKVKWPWRYRSRSKVITCDAPSHAHLPMLVIICIKIWKESIQNYRRYRADTIFKTKAKWPWIYRSRSKVIICNTPSHTSNHLW